MDGDGNSWTNMYFGATIFRQLTMAQLQKLCRHNGLSALGRHTTLENRLKNAGVASAAAPNDQPDQSCVSKNIWWINFNQWYQAADLIWYTLNHTLLGTLQRMSGLFGLTMSIWAGLPLVKIQIMTRPNSPDTCMSPAHTKKAELGITIINNSLLNEMCWRQRRDWQIDF